MSNFSLIFKNRINLRKNKLEDNKSKIEFEQSIVKRNNFPGEDKIERFIHDIVQFKGHF